MGPLPYSLCPLLSLSIIDFHKEITRITRSNIIRLCDSLFVYYPDGALIQYKLLGRAD